ncbi:MAG: hypothetical protein LJE67_02360 [Salaquimonas sp.]|nr:hypothetical protein [Salaquimonas sp.]
MISKLINDLLRSKPKKCCTNAAQQFCSICAAKPTHAAQQISWRLQVIPGIPPTLRVTPVCMATGVTARVGLNRKPIKPFRSRDGLFEIGLHYPATLGIGGAFALYEAQFPAARPLTVHEQD